MELTARRKEGEYIADLARSVVCRSLRIRAATATAISLMPVRHRVMQFSAVCVTANPLFLLAWSGRHEDIPVFS
jgi:hypothetical protein